MLSKMGLGYLGTAYSDFIIWKTHLYAFPWALPSRTHVRYVRASSVKLQIVEY
jgi:hypothetical protein